MTPVGPEQLEPKLNRDVIELAASGNRSPDSLQTKVTPIRGANNLHFSAGREDAPEESQMGGDGCRGLPACDVVRLSLGRCAATGRWQHL